MTTSLAIASDYITDPNAPHALAVAYAILIGKGVVVDATDKSGATLYEIVCDESGPCDEVESWIQGDEWEISMPPTFGWLLPESGRFIRVERDAHASVYRIVG